MQEHLPHYRAPFFQMLRDELSQNGIELRLAYSPTSSQSHLPGVLPWAKPVTLRRFGPLSWQWVLPLARGTSLVVAPQEIKYAIIPVLMFFRRIGKWKFAFWGHGKNFQARHPDSLGELWKRFLSRQVDWWFAYNARSVHVVRELGFPADRITDVSNAIDTRTLIALRAQISTSHQQALRQELNLIGKNVAIFTGRLYPHKRIPFLLKACRKVRQILPDFELLVLGSGPEEKQVREASRQNPWIHFAGPKNDQEKVPYWSLAKVALMPGLVGLGVLDALAMGVPLVTTDYPYHSPEIDYLSHGENGWISHPWDDSEAYADAVVKILKSPSLHQRLAEGGFAKAKTLTIEAMSHRFCIGILRCLASAPR